MGTAKERGVQIAYAGDIAYWSSNTVTNPIVGVGYKERPWFMGRYATLYNRYKADDTKIVIKLLNVLSTPRDDINQIKYLLVDKSCLKPVDDKELFAARLKGL